MKVIATSLSEVRIEPENEIERLLLLRWSEGKPRIAPAEGKAKDFTHLFIAFDAKPPGPPDAPRTGIREFA